MNNETTTPKRGGSRAGSGRKKSEAPTVTATFRVDEEAHRKCKENYKRGLNSKVNEFIKKLSCEPPPPTPQSD